MKILYVTYFGPPYNCMGSIRALKIIKELEEIGHEVILLTGEPKELMMDLPRHDKTISISHLNLRAHHSKLDYNQKTRSNTNFKNNNIFVKKYKKSALNFLKKLIHEFFIPDIEIFWFKKSKKMTPKLLKEMREKYNFNPDIIYASCLPVSSALVSKHISKILKIPYFIEYRDSWTDSPYRNTGLIRTYIDKVIERKLIESSSGIIGVTRYLSNIGKIHGKPYIEVLTGFDKKILQDNKKLNLKRGLCDDKKIIFFGGIIYKDKRDPINLIKAFNDNIEYIADEYLLIFAGSNYEHLINYSKSKSVIFLGKISKSECDSYLLQADILLLLTWDNDYEKGIISGKVYEYLEYGKPILHLGCVNGETAEIVKSVGYSAKPTVSPLKIVDLIYEIAENSFPFKHVNENFYNSLSTTSQVKKLNVFLKENLF